MKKTLIAIIAAVVVIAAGIFAFNAFNGSKNQETITKNTLTVGLEGTYAPFNYRENGKLTGYEVELSRAIAKKLDYKVKFVQTKWDSLIAGLSAKRYDVVMNNISKNPEREKTYLFGSPYLYAHTVLIERSDENMTSVDDVEGRSFAQSTSSNYGETARSLGAKIVAVPGFTEAMNLIQTNRADGTINDLSAYTIWKAENPNADIKAESLDADIKPIAAYPLFEKTSTKLKNKVDKAIAELRADGTLKKLSEEFFKADITEK